MSITALLVFAIFFIFAVIGLVRGFFKKIFTVVALVACFFIAGALTGPVSDWAINNTKLSSSIEDATYSVLDTTTAGDPLLSSQEATHRLTESELSVITSNPSMVIDTVNQYTEGLMLPVNFKKTMTLTESEVRGLLLDPDVTIRSIVLRSAASRIAGHIVKILVYLLICLGVYIALRIIFAVLKFTGRFKAVSMGNRFGGLLVGLGEGLLVVWIFMMFITMLNPLPIGQAAMSQIGESPVLKALYDSNLLWNFVRI